MGVQIHRDGAGYLLTARQQFTGTPADVFPFFAEAGNLERITPRRVAFNIRTPLPITMREGQFIDYALRIRGMPVRWRTEITAWDPPHRFVDTQRRGPYRWWTHEHRFTDLGGTTLMIDEVRYGVPGGRLVHELFVRRDLHHIFEYRQRVLGEIFKAPRDADV